MDHPAGRVKAEDISEGGFHQHQEAVAGPEDQPQGHEGHDAPGIVADEVVGELFQAAEDVLLNLGHGEFQVAVKGVGQSHFQPEALGHGEAQGQERHQAHQAIIGQGRRLHGPVDDSGLLQFVIDDHNLVTEAGLFFSRRA